MFTVCSAALSTSGIMEQRVHDRVSTLLVSRALLKYAKRYTCMHSSTQVTQYIAMHNAKKVAGNIEAVARPLLPNVVINDTRMSLRDWTCQMEGEVMMSFTVTIFCLLTVGSVPS